MASQEAQKKHRWSTVFKKKEPKRESDLPTEQTSSSAQDGQLSAYQTNGHAYQRNQSPFQSNLVDSAYASSEPPSVHSGDANIVSVENNGRFNNVSSDRNLAMNKTTGDVLDKDTGEVVSTITTTTTTTTITTTKKGPNGETIVDVQTRPAGEISTAARPQETLTAARPPAERSTTPRPTEALQQAGIVEAPGDSVQIHPRSRQENIQPSTSQAQQPRRSPNIPARSPHRASRELDSTQNQASPGSNTAAGYNFSHPSRGPQPASTPLQPGGGQLGTDNYAQPPTRSTFDSLRTLVKDEQTLETFANLKAAAKGLHGVGETLRGVLNNEVDSRYTHDPQKQAAVNAKNQEVIERGRQEMSMGRMPERREQRENWNSAGGPASVPGYGAQVVSPIEPQSAQWQDQTIPPPDSGERRGFKKLIRKKQSQ